MPLDSHEPMTICPIWAGTDLYKMVHIPARLQGDNAAILAEVRRQINHQLIDDFGMGVDLIPDAEPQVFHINVDNVLL